MATDRTRERRFTNRRTFLRSAGVLAGTGMIGGLAGCLGGGDGGGSSDSGGGSSGGSSGGNGGGGGDGSSSSGESAKNGDAKLRQKYGLPDLGYELEGSLNVFQWTDYWPQGTVEKFEKAYGVKVNVSNYASNEEMFNKLKAGGTGQFDLVFPSDYMVNIMADQELIQPLAMNKLPQWDNLESFWINTAPYDPGGQRFSAPYFWGTTGIGWNKNMIGDVTLDSWDALWSQEYKGTITDLDDMRETIGMALKRLGYSLNSKKESQITEAKELLIQQKPLLLTYDSVNMAENLINENASPIHSWSGSPFQAYWELYEEKKGSPIGYRVPKEGGVVWIDTAAVTKEAKSPNAAHAFINFASLNAKMNAEIANYLYYPSPNKAAKEFIDDAALQNKQIYPPQKVFEKLEFIKNLGQATTVWNEAWTEIKSA